MRELVIVLSDLYLSQESRERELPPGVALPGLQNVARFGKRSEVEGGWRSWLARWLAVDVQLPAASATIAAMALAPGTSQQVALGAARPTPLQAPTVWIATPVHLVTGLTSLHLDRRGILRLPAGDATTIASDFRRVFHDSGFDLMPLDSGDFLLSGPQMPVTETLEPARSMGGSVVDAQRGSAGNPALRRLGAEIEMWFHDHPVNDARRRRGELPVTGLWFWGGGPAPGPRLAPEPHPASPPVAFGRDAYLQGLWASMGEKLLPLPQQLEDVFGYPHARRATLAIETGSMLHSNPTWTFFDAVAQIDRRFIAPAVGALNQGRLEQLIIVANDRQLTLRARDRFKLWRRTPPGLSGLQ